MNISGPAAVAKPEMLFYAPGDLTVTVELHVLAYSTRFLNLLGKKQHSKIQET